VGVLRGSKRDLQSRELGSKRLEVRAQFRNLKSTKGKRRFCTGLFGGPVFEERRSRKGGATAW